MCKYIVVCVYIYIYSDGWGESKLAKMACSGSLAAHFINNDYITAEIIYSSVHTFRRYWLGQELPCAVGICELHLKSSGITAVSLAVSIGSAMRRENMCVYCDGSSRRGYCCGHCASQERRCLALGYATADAMGAASSRR